MDLFVLADTSQDIPQSTFDRIRDFIESIGRVYVDTDGKVRVSIIGYGEKSKVILPKKQGTSLMALRMGMKNFIQTKDERKLGNALENVRNMIQRAGDVRRNAGSLVLAMAAGKNSIADSSKMVAEADKLKRAGIPVAAIGIGKAAKENMFLSIASSPRNAFKVENTDDIWNVMSDVSRLVGVAKKLGHKLDLGFIVGADKSGSSDDFDLGKSLIVEMLKSIEVSPDNSRIAVIVYGREAKVVFPLNIVTNREAAIQRIEALKRPDGSSGLSKAIELSRQVMNAEISDREGIPKTVIILTNSGIDTSARLAASLLIADGIKVKGVRLGKQGTLDEISSITTKPSDAVQLLNSAGINTLATALLSSLLPGWFLLKHNIIFLT